MRPLTKRLGILGLAALFATILSTVTTSLRGSNISNGGGTASGPAGGALTGTYPNPTLATLTNVNRVPFEKGDGTLIDFFTFGFDSAQDSGRGQLQVAGLVVDRTNNCDPINFGSSTDSQLWRDNSFCSPAIGNGTLAYGSNNVANIAWRNFGQLAMYSHVNTAGFGQGAIYASVNLTAQTASIGATNLSCGGATCPAGTYRASVEQIITTAGTSGTLQTSVLWNDGTAARTESPANLTFGTTARDDGTFVFTADGATAIQYSTTLTSPVGSPQYSVTVILERIR